MTNEGPQEDRAGSWSHTQRISYRADIRDAGEFLHCYSYSEQTYDQGTVTRHTGAGEAARYYLSVKMTPVTGAVVSASAIGAIIGSKTDELSRATANLLRSMASTEEGSVKNRLLDAAKGLTDSVGVLLTESDRSAQQYKNLTGDINSLAGAVGEEDSETGETRQLAVSLGENIVELIEQTCVQTVIPGHETRQAVAGRAGTVAECSVKLLTSVNSLAKVKDC